MLRSVNSIILADKTYRLFNAAQRSFRFMTIKLFGIAKDITGSNTIHVSVDTIATVGALRHWLAAEYPAFAKLKSLAVAVDSEYAEDEQNITDAEEIALIPPVSGG